MAFLGEIYRQIATYSSESVFVQGLAYIRINGGQ